LKPFAQLRKQIFPSHAGPVKVHKLSGQCRCSLLKVARRSLLATAMPGARVVLAVRAQPVTLIKHLYHFSYLTNSSSDFLFFIPGVSAGYPRGVKKSGTTSVGMDRTLRALASSNAAM
jgi:hypothetical protein